MFFWAWIETLCVHLSLCSVLFSSRSDEKTCDMPVVLVNERAVHQAAPDWSIIGTRSALSGNRWVLPVRSFESGSLIWGILAAALMLCASPYVSSASGGQSWRNVRQGVCVAQICPERASALPPARLSCHTPVDGKDRCLSHMSPVSMD